MHLTLKPPILLAISLIHLCTAIPAPPTSSVANPSTNPDALKAVFQWRGSKPQPATLSQNQTTATSPNPNDTNLGIPLDPSRKPPVDIHGSYVDPNPIPPGFLLYNLFFSITHLWTFTSNAAINVPTEIRAPQHPYIFTKLTPGTVARVALTPLKAAWGLNLVISACLAAEQWHTLGFELRDRRVTIADILTGIDVDPLNSRDVPKDTSIAGIGGNSTTATGSLLRAIDVNVQYTGEALATQHVLGLWWNLFEDIWAKQAAANTGLTTGEDWALQYPTLGIEIEISILTDEAFTWAEFSDGVLKMVDMQAQAGRWEFATGEMARDGTSLVGVKMQRIAQRGVASQDETATS